MRDYMTMIYNLNPHLFKSPEEIRQIINLREEQKYICSHYGNARWKTYLHP
ncbi:hypothetical protein NXX23_24100 [Bacteroides ovatus]|nr:hypothetical protein [Bacteroides ovatus]